VVHGILPHVVTNIVSGYIDVFKNRGHLGKLGLVVEYTPATCFQKFGEQVSEARRAGDADPNKKIIAETNKLDGNSSYGKTVTNKLGVLVDKTSNLHG
jgi:hypothetical protein